METVLALWHLARMRRSHELFIHPSAPIPYTLDMSRQPRRFPTGRSWVTLTMGFLAAAGISAESVAIKVETQKGKPIEGAVVTLRNQEDGTALDSATTSTEGIAVVQQLSPGEWYFEVDRPGYMLYTAYVQIRSGKKPELGFASQVSRGDDWEPMRVKFLKASPGLMRKAIIASPVAADARPEQRRAADIVRTKPETDPSVQTVAVPSTVEDAEPVSVTAGAPPAAELEVADGDPQPLAEGADVSDAGPEAEMQEVAVEDVDSDPAEGMATAAGAVAATAAAVPIVDDDDQADIGQVGVDSIADAADEAEEAPQKDPPQPDLLAEQEIDTPAPTAPPVPPTAGTEPSPPVVEEQVEETGATTAEPAVAAPSPEPEATQIDQPETVPTVEETDSAPAVEPMPERPSTPISGPPATSRALRSSAAGNCPECAAGEWAVTAHVDAATAGDTRSTSACPEDLDDRLREFSQQLAGRPQGGFAGPLMATLWHTPDDDDRASLAQAAAGFTSANGNCQVAGVVLPRGASMTGYALEAWDDLGGRACSAEGICALPKAGWSGSPEVVEGDEGTVIYAVFRNRSTRHQRSAELTVLFEPPPEWQ